MCVCAHMHMHIRVHVIPMYSQFQVACPMNAQWETNLMTNQMDSIYTQHTNNTGYGNLYGSTWFFLLLIWDKSLEIAVISQQDVVAVN